MTEDPFVAMLERVKGDGCQCVWCRAYVDGLIERVKKV